MDFPCAQLLGLTETKNFFGESFNWSNTQTISIRGKITGDYGAESVSGIWSAMNSMREASITQDLTHIYVNSVSIGTGIVISLNFDQGTDVREKNYTASFQIQYHAGSGRYSNSGYMPATGDYFYGNVSDNIVRFFTGAAGRGITEFSESFNFNTVSKDSYSYSKNLSFSLNNDIVSSLYGTPEDYAKEIIRSSKKTYGYINILSAFYPSFYEHQSGISYSSESYDVINKSYSYSEKFDFHSGRNYIWDYNHSLNVNDGLISITENGSILSSQSGAAKISAALSAWTGIQTGMYDRMVDIYRFYTGILYYSGGCGLRNQPETSQITKDLCIGSINYSKTYSNNPFNQSGYSYSYEDNISLDSDGYLTISENGTFKAFENNPPSGLNTVYAAFTGAQSEIATRIDSFYTGYLSSFVSCYRSTGIFLAESEETLSEYNAELDYSRTYRENPVYYNDGLFSKVVTSYTDNSPVHIYNYFPIISDQIIQQSATQTTRNTFTNSITMVGRSGTTLDDFLTGAFSRVIQPSGLDIYASNFNYDYSPLTNNFSMSLDYRYGRQIDAGNYLIQ